MTNNTLYNIYDSFSSRGFLDTDDFNRSFIKIKNNLNNRFVLRDYQVDAFKRFLYYIEKDNQINRENNGISINTHLAFQMATGSGKTIIMAGLILYLYEKGYRNFLFFVNSNNIINKTKDNFLNKSSNKYLFNENISINNKIINIKEVNNFEGVNNQDINICFTTTHQLHTDLNNEKENSITIKDFEKYKIILLSDEAHHSQSTTKSKSKNKNEKQSTLGEKFESESWENTVMEVFNRNKNNMLLEFTATLDTEHIDIKDKYNDKLIYKYNFKAFRDAGWSKDPNLFSTDTDKKSRILLAVILNQYRQEIANKYKINLKPVILFKAQKTTAESTENYNYFIKIINELNKKDINILREKFLNKISSNKESEKLLKRIFTFLEKENISDEILVERLKDNFKKEYCINMNEDINLDNKTIQGKDRDAKLRQERLINSLEDKNNQIRAVFAVYKLNEGWDVLNLYDIVRLYEGRQSGGKKLSKTTISEAQLIGRGARYFPFEYNNEIDRKYKRKFDNDINTDLRILEELHYHSENEHRYISEIKLAMRNEGLIDQNETKEIEFNIKDNFKNTHLYKKGVVWKNEKVKKDFKQGDIISKVKDSPFIKNGFEYKIKTNTLEESEILNNENKNTDNNKSLKIERISLGNIDKNIFLSSIHKNEFFDFDNLKKYIKDLESVDELVENKKYFKNIEIVFENVNNGNINNLDKLEAMSMFLKEIANYLRYEVSEYKGTKEFYRYTFKEIFDKENTGNYILKLSEEKAKKIENDSNDFFIFDKFYGTSEEKSLIEFIKNEIDNIVNKKYTEIYLVRNERKLKIYNFNDGEAFEPDFLLFMNNKKGNNEIYYQIFIEPKGDQSKDFVQDFKFGNQGWKEDFLLEIEKNCILDKNSFIKENGEYKIIGLPFYNKNDESDFRENFNSKFR